MQRWISYRRTNFEPLFEQEALPTKSRLVRPCGMRRLRSTPLLCIVGVLLVCTLLTILNVYELHRSEKEPQVPVAKVKVPVKSPTFILYGRNLESGYLKHVLVLFERLGFQREDNESGWDVMWAHDYPFRAMYSVLKNLKSHQKVNHFPGSGYITNKVELATSSLPHIPVAFKIPVDKEKLLQHAKNHPEMLFVQKSNNHRGIRIQHLEGLDLGAAGSFVQEYVSKPLLVDGHKFDIGLYTTLTSIDPLRVYIYSGDVLFRFCPEKYHPFDPKVLDKYVVGDDYLPTWEVPALRRYYVELGFSMKESFNAYIRSTGKDPSVIWRQVDEAIRSVYLRKEPSLLESASHYKSTTNFFEMVRFDFVIDEDLNVFIMEANMSPNLSSAHYPPNRLLYEQVLFSLMSLVGIGRRTKSDSLKVRSVEEENMQVSEKNIAVFPDTCVRPQCQSCMAPECQLCKPCLTNSTVGKIKAAYLEHINRLDCRRVFPPSMNPETVNKTLDLEKYSPENQLLYRWFQGKCLLDPSWCT